MNSICFFSSYYPSGNIPCYVKVYLEELIRHFTQVVFLTNEKPLSNADLAFLSQNNIEHRLYENKGFDFGMWRKALREFPANEFDRIGFVNDSCILYGKLDSFFEWMNKEGPDYCGMTDSNALSYHIQSYFLVINKPAIPVVIEYLKENAEPGNMKDVINRFEVGLSKLVGEHKLKLAARYSHKEYKGEFNPMLVFADKLIREGIPLIKKKILFSSFRPDEWRTLMRMNYDPDALNAVKLIEQSNKELLLDLNKLVDEQSKDGAKWRYNKFRVKSFFYQRIRKLKR